MSDDPLRGIDLDRVWFELYGHHFEEVGTDELLDLVSDHARRLEQSARCVAFARPVEGGGSESRGSDGRVQLVCICDREADKDYLELFFNQTSHEVYDNLMEEYA